MSARTCSDGTPAADEPGRKWCGDIPPQAGGAPSYVRTWTGFVYLATVLDCCTKKVVGYAMADHMHTSLVCQAIDMAVRRCPVKKGVTIFHSDRGSQYTSQEFLDHLKGYGIRPSVGRTGVCWDNAWAESFNATLKNERVHRMVYPTKDKAIKDIASWIELRYESYSSSLSPRVSHSRRGRTRFLEPEEGSLKHKQTLPEKTPGSPEGLVILPCEVVNAVGGGLAVQGGVGSVVVVVVEPGLVGDLALGLAGVGVGVGPLMGQSAVKALDLAVGLGPVGAGVAVLDAG